MERMLPACDRALSYTLTHSWRWDTTHGLVKRPYTIDTWDFDYTAGRAPWLNFQITDDTYWGIMHGDNSGLYEAAVLLGRLYDVVGGAHAADRWRELAEGIRTRANALLFNGRFYTHFFKLTPVSIDGVDEANQLSLSNPMAINRRMATHDIAVAILQEFIRRGESSPAFAPWFSIDPPFPSGIFGDEKLVSGAYINGGIFPLAGGELARAAFEHGFESYGCEILHRYRRMIGESGESYLWYFPDGTPSTVETSTSPEATPTDGWGSSAMLYAFVEGLCGIEDRSHSFQEVRCAPRWAAAGEAEAAVRVGYAASGAAFGYRFRHAVGEGRLHLAIETAGSKVALHALLPEGGVAREVRCEGEPIRFTTTTIGQSRYVDAEITVRGSAAVEVAYGLA
jgi:hypothetical protein